MIAFSLPAFCLHIRHLKRRGEPGGQGHGLHQRLPCSHQHFLCALALKRPRDHPRVPLFSLPLTPSCTDGNLRVLNTETGAITQTVKAHSAEITSLVKSADGALLATSSKDAKAKVFDATTLEELMTFTTDRALNSVALSPIREHLLAVGGVEARDVTTTHSEKMEVRARRGVKGRACSLTSLRARKSAV